MVPNVPRDYSIPHASVELIPACIQKVLTECMYTCLNEQIICNCSCVANLFLYTSINTCFINRYRYIRHLTKVIPKVIDLKGEPT